MIGTGGFKKQVQFEPRIRVTLKKPPKSDLTYDQLPLEPSSVHKKLFSAQTSQFTQKNKYYSFPV